MPVMESTYIAQGFRNDAEKLLGKFEAMESLKFDHFAQIWRELRFSLIYMGRFSLKDLKEFTEECFRNTLMFLDLHRPYIKVGAVYLLYSLYLKEPILLLGSPVKIAITIKHIEEIQQLENFFTEEEHGETCWELSYIINKLFKMEAFHISHSTILYGPLVPYSLIQLPAIRESEFLNSLENLKMVYNTCIKDLVEMMGKYQELKNLIPVPNSNDISEADLEKLKNLSLDIEKYKQRYDDGLPLGIMQEGTIINPSIPSTTDKEVSVGKRRLMLKSQQFERPAVPDSSASRIPLPEKYVSYTASQIPLAETPLRYTASQIPPPETPLKYTASHQLNGLRRRGPKVLVRERRPKKLTPVEDPSTDEENEILIPEVNERREGLRPKVRLKVKYSSSEDDDIDSPASDPDFNVNDAIKEERKRGRPPKIPKVEINSSCSDENYVDKRVSKCSSPPVKEKRKRGRPRIHIKQEKKDKNVKKTRAPKPKRTHLYEE